MKFADSHEWIEEQSNGVVRLGITAYAQEVLGEIVYVQLPIVGKQVHAQQEVAVVESTKAATDIYSPVTGIIAEVNLRLEQSPELMNQSPEEEGWICKIQLTNSVELDRLMNRVEYDAMLNA
jgi:glycine cleavage system H protein